MPGGHSGHLDLGRSGCQGIDALDREKRQARHDRSDNGTEFTSNAILAWSQDHQIEWHYTAPGKPTQNAYVESFNGRMRDELLNESLFISLAHARAAIGNWAPDYNTARPHSSLGYHTPAVHAEILKSMGSASPPLRGSEVDPIDHITPTGVTLGETLPMAG